MRLKLLLTIFSSIVFVTAILGGWFYWFQWRPSEIRKICTQEAANKADSEVNKYIKALAPEKADEEINQKTNSYYQECLTEHGLEP